MNAFQSRSYLHDKVAIPYVQELLAKYDLEGIPYGVEVHDKNLQRALMLFGRQDEMALKNRYKPDLCIVPRPDGMKINPKVRPFLCEVKSENETHPNFAIEFDSFCAAELWDNGQRNVIYIFVKMAQGVPIEARACWVSGLCFKPVFVPRRFDFEKNIKELEAKYPRIKFQPVEHTGGSGTPYFLIRQDASYLRLFDSFIAQFLELPSNEIIQQPAIAQLALF